MNRYIKSILVLFIACVLASPMNAQLVKKVTVADAKNLQLHAAEFEGKPLSALLKEIAPDIKMAVVIPYNGGEQAGSIKFGFRDMKEYRKKNGVDTTAGCPIITITILIAEKFDHNPGKAKDTFDWTKEDVAWYKDLKITAIRVSVNQKPIKAL